MKDLFSVTGVEVEPEEFTAKVRVRNNRTGFSTYLDFYITENDRIEEQVLPVREIKAMMRGEASCIKDMAAELMKLIDAANLYIKNEIAYTTRTGMINRLTTVRV